MTSLGTKKIIQLNRISREYRMGSETVKALSNIDLEIRSGEFVAVMGTSGSGKTTLLNMLGCLDIPSSGEYLLDGVNVRGLSKNRLASLRNRKIGFVFQSYNLLARTSALENVELPLIYNNELSTSERKERSLAALKRVGLYERKDHTSSQMSGGQQQRVAIARAVVNDPVIILADEATGNLDTRSSYEIMSLFQELNDSGITIVFVTHEPDIASFCKRVVTLKDGEVISNVVNSDVNRAEEMIKAVVVKDMTGEDLEL